MEGYRGFQSILGSVIGTWLGIMGVSSGFFFSSISFVIISFCRCGCFF